MELNSFYLRYNKEQEKERLEGTLEYIFGLTVWNMDFPL